MARLEGKVAIITGAGSGQGRAAAVMFATEGARVVVSDVNDEGGEHTVDQIHEQGGDATYCHADVSIASEVQALVEAARSRYGALSILYNNAALWSGGNMDNFVTDLEEDNWDQILGVNLKGIFLCCKYGIPALIENGGVR